MERIIKYLSHIDRRTQEGRLLLAALAKLTTESQTDKTPEEVILQLHDLADEMFDLADEMFKDTRPDEVTDEEIKKAAAMYVKNMGESWQKDASIDFTKGAEWMRNRMK